MHCISSLTVFCTVIPAVWAKCNYKHATSYEAPAQIDIGRAAKFVVDACVSFGWPYLYTYTSLFAHVRLRILILRNVVLNDLIVAVFTRLSAYITL